jgi:hypothetical protein
MYRNLLASALVLSICFSCFTLISCDKIRDKDLIGNWIAEYSITTENDTVKFPSGEEITLAIGDDGFGNIRRTLKQEDFRWRTMPHKFIMMFHDNINETIIYKLKSDTLTMTFKESYYKSDVYLFTPQKK